MDLFTTARDKSQWEWTAMIMVPDWISSDLFDDAVHRAAAKNRPTALSELHHDFIPNSGLRMTGKHHEVYLSDPRRVETAKLRTILRQPVAAA